MLSEAQSFLLNTARAWDLNTLVESGTGEGAYTVFALCNHFETIHTIEIEPAAWRVARRNLSTFKHVHCWFGDSAVVMPKILRLLDKPALFWLDGHWCLPGSNPNGPDTPVREELHHLMLADQRHVILIDDARVFREGWAWEVEQYDYPTLSWVRTLAEENGYAYQLTSDIIQLTPKD